MVLRVQNNQPIIENLFTSNASTVTDTQKDTTVFQNSKNKTKNNQKTEAKKALENRITELLDLEDNFLNVSIIEIDRKKYLKLSRNQNDKIRSGQRSSFNMGAIKSKLGIKDNVISKHNDMKDITGRELYEISNSATIEPGKTMVIPLSELGQNYSWYQFARKDLSDYVKKYIQAK